MKKRILSLLLIFGMLLLLSSCSKREAITADDFKSSMEGLEYTLTDATSQFDAGLVESVQLAEKDTCKIEFYVVESTAQAQNAYKTNKENIEKAEKLSSTSSHKSVSLKNYGYYKATTGDLYYVISRIDKTFIYAAIPLKYKDKASDIISDLGY
ncbi:hypothetical protein [Clostridium lacusfryxellense]|uniref:hypothetical protein n=1 Tax=Clostridium lacusfryxellense TaxID=205328 RepID=UPI001C0E2005|nr:hypothetical protein [Clostridium lacusfryxellense]MBU3113996.1 hypothetical protein [Clostridium lacusfryxellense]